MPNCEYCNAISTDSPRATGNRTPSLPADQMAGRIISRSGHRPPRQESQIRDRAVLQGTEEDMPNDAADGHGLREIEDVDEVIPTRIDVERILVRFEACRVIAVILIDGSHFQITVLQDRDTGLNADNPVVGSECPLAESDIEVERANRKHVQNGFLWPCR